MSRESTLLINAATITINFLLLRNYYITYIQIIISYIENKIIILQKLFKQYLSSNTDTKNFKKEP